MEAEYWLKQVKYSYGQPFGYRSVLTECWLKQAKYSYGEPFKRDLLLNGTNHSTVKLPLLEGMSRQLIDILSVCTN